MATSLANLTLALHRATRPGMPFDADLCRAVLTACSSSTSTTTTSPSTTSPNAASHTPPHPLAQQQQLHRRSPSAESPATPDDDVALSSSSSGVASPLSSLASTADHAVTTTTTTTTTTSVNVDELAGRLRSAVVGALSRPVAMFGVDELDLIDRGKFVETAAALVGKLERSEPDMALWLPYLAAIVSVGGAVAVAPAVRRVLAPSTLAAVTSLRVRRDEAATPPMPLSPPLSPRGGGGGAAGGAAGASVDEQRLQRYARIERGERVRQSYVAVLTAVLKDWHLLPLVPRNACKMMLLLCELSGAALVREVLLRQARDEPAAFWRSLIAGIDPLLGTQLAAAAPATSHARRHSSGSATPTADAADTPPMQRTLSPLVRINEEGPLSDAAATVGGAPASAGEASETITVDSPRHRAMLAALFVALAAWRRAIDDDAQRARLADAMLASGFLEQTRRVHGIGGIDTSSSLPFALRQLRIATVAFADIAMSPLVTTQHIHFFLELWMYCKRVGVASGCLSTVPLRDVEQSSSSSSSSSDDELDGVLLPPAHDQATAMQRYHGEAFWSAFAGLTSHLHAAFPWHMQRALCDLTVNNAGVAYRITSALRCNPLLALVTYDTEMPPTAEALQRLGTAREFERFAASLVVSVDSAAGGGGGGEALLDGAYDESDVASALEFERVLKRQHLAARLRAEVSSRSARLALASERLLESEYARQLAQLKELFAEQQQAQRELVAKKDAWTSKLQTRIENLITINNRLTEQCKQASIEAAAFKEIVDERQGKLRDAAERLVRARIEADDQQQQLSEAREQVQVLIGLVRDAEARDALRSSLDADRAAAPPCATCALLGAQLAAAERRRAQSEQALVAAELRALELAADVERAAREREAARALFDRLEARLDAERHAASQQAALQRESRTALSERVLELSEKIDSLQTKK